MSKVLITILIATVIVTGCADQTNPPSDISLEKLTSDYNPLWSPDGDYILFTSNRDGNKEIY